MAELLASTQKVGVQFPLTAPIIGTWSSQVKALDLRLKSRLRATLRSYQTQTGFVRDPVPQGLRQRFESARADQP